MHVNDPEEANPDVHQLRALHARMDAAVFTAYGWIDLLSQCHCEFLLDYEEEETEPDAEGSTGRRKKRPWRFRWLDEIRDEVLARLLKLNAERAEEERLAAGMSLSIVKSNKAGKSTSNPNAGKLF